jgi:ribosomal-protein-alanine N-acetyltransferase
MTETLVIRTMEEGDLSRVVELERQLQSFPWTETHFRDSLAAGHGAWVVEADGRPVAFAILMMVIDEAHLLDIGVAREFQRQGIATRLLRHLYSRANELGALSIFLEVRPSNDAAARIYEREGFAVIGRRKGYYPAAEGREDAIVMMRPL